MVKIKTFEFLISNYVGNENFIDYSSNKEGEQFKRPKYDGGTVYSPESVDLEINNFCRGKDIIDIKTDTYTLHRHNNARCDSVVARYTIIYKGGK